MDNSRFALINIINYATTTDIPETSMRYIEETDAAPKYTLSRTADVFHPIAIAIYATSATPNPFINSKDIFILKIGGTEILRIPLSLLYLESERAIFVPSSGKYYLQFDFKKWLDEIPLLCLAFHTVQCFLHSGTPFFLQSSFKMMDTSDRRALVNKIAPPGQSFFYQLPSTYTMPADRLTVPQMEARPNFSGYSKGYLIEAQIDQLRSLQIIFEIDSKLYKCVFGPDQIATCCTRLSDTYLWIPINPDNKTPFNKERESFIGAIYQNQYKITFMFDFESVQENLRIHSIHYNILKYITGMARREYEIPSEVCDRH